jgi:hypothetical protein
MTSSISTASGAPAPLWRRAFEWWLVQVKHVLPPTIFFFFFGFNLVLFTRWATLQERGIPFTNFFAATLLALLVGKAVLVVDNLRLMHRFDGAPLMQPILFKSSIYWLCVFVLRLAEALWHFLRDGGLAAQSLSGPWAQAFGLPVGMKEAAADVAKSGHVDMLDGGPKANPKPSLGNGVPGSTRARHRPS